MLYHSSCCQMYKQKSTSSLGSDDHPNNRHTSLFCSKRLTNNHHLVRGPIRYQCLLSWQKQRSIGQHLRRLGMQHLQQKAELGQSDQIFYSVRPLFLDRMYVEQYPCSRMASPQKLEYRFQQHRGQEGFFLPVHLDQ